jgi:hypothetical protein
MKDDERFAKSIAAPLRAAEHVDATFTARVMASVWTIAAISPPGQLAHGERLVQHHGHSPEDVTSRKWWRRPVTFHLTPLSSLAVAAGIATIVAWGDISLRHARLIQGSNPPITAGPNMSTTVLHDTTYIVRFMLLAPTASSVTLVGDFNNWNRGTIHLVPTGHKGVWTASVAVPAGQHEYAFIVDGIHWTADPHARLTVADDFGTESSILTVGTHATPPAA